MEMWPSFTTQTVFVALFLRKRPCKCAHVRPAEAKSTSTEMWDKSSKRGGSKQASLSRVYLLRLGDQVEFFHPCSKGENIKVQLELNHLVLPSYEIKA